MMCRICGYNLYKIDFNNCVDPCKSCGQCSTQHKNMVKCPNCGYVNYIENNNHNSILKWTKEKLSI